MPDAAITSALTSLIPSLPASNKPFPPLLVSRCESLLALSRQRASHLKPEEEIARAHACAEITCTKLRAQLRLPAIKNGAGAPCKPKVYAKLIRFLEGALGDSTTAGDSLTTTPRGRKRDGNGNVKEAPIPTPAQAENSVVDTPSKTKWRSTGKASASGFAGTIKTGNNKKTSSAAENDDNRAPLFVMPSIRTLCKIFATPTIAPHVYTGVCLILADSNLSQVIAVVDDDDSNTSDLLALIVALYLMVLTRMQDTQMTTDLYTDVSTKSVAALGGNNNDDSAATVGVEQVEEWINKLNERNWCTDPDAAGSEWWNSVPENVLAEISIDNPEDGNDGDHDDADTTIVVGQTQTQTQNRKRDLLDAEEDETETNGNALLPGLGTMLHDGIDWTGHDKRVDYREWYESMAKKLKLKQKQKQKQKRETPVKAAAGPKGRSRGGIAVA